MSVKDTILRSTLANVVAGILVLAGMFFFISIGDVEKVMTLATLGAGWILKEVKK